MKFGRALEKMAVRTAREEVEKDGYGRCRV